MPPRTPSRLAALLVGAAALLSACAAPDAVTSPSPTPPRSSSPAPAASGPAAPTASATGTPEPSAAPTPASAPTPTPRSDPPTLTDQPFEVDGIPVVSKRHRLTSAYTPPWANRPNGLHPDVAAAFSRLQAAAKRDGLALSIRSGYRSWAAQKASFDNALRQYDEKTARLYFAEAGASEHQTGLALDAWDGRNRGTAFSRTPQAAWLAAHAHEFGFIVRYPQGKSDITGYAWESWHLRWVGTDVSQRFGPGATLTLEEYLGLA